MPAPVAAAAAGGGAAAAGGGAMAAAGRALLGGLGRGAGAAGGRAVGGSAARGQGAKALMADVGVEMLSNKLNNSATPAPSSSSGSPIPLSTPSSQNDPGGHNWGSLGRTICFLGGCGERS